MIAWSYKTVELSSQVGPDVQSTINEELRRLGAKGWELVAVAPTHPGRLLFLFKRIVAPAQQPQMGG